MKLLFIVLLSPAALINSRISAVQYSLLHITVHLYYYSNEDGLDINGATRDQRGNKISQLLLQVIISAGSYNERSGAPIVAKNSFPFAGISLNPVENPIFLRINETWLKNEYFRLIVRIFDQTPGKALYSNLPLMDDTEGRIMLTPPDFREHAILRSPTKMKTFYSSRIAVGYSVVCPEHLYGVKCDTFCMPNSNYECSIKGGKLCRPGWSDANKDCKTPSGCTAYYCLNGGTCVEGAKEFTCTCPTSFEGSRCQRCNLNCNSGTCALQGGKATCKCPINASGPDCGVAVDPCDKLKPCSNRGECLYKVAATGHVRYVCVCKPGFAGLDCEDRVDACKDNMCVNGSTCVNNANSRNGYQCLCPAHATGVFCEKDVNECEADPKLCDKDSEKCINTYGGYYCEMSKHGYCKNVDCGEGGTCKDLDYKYVCECKKGWSGHNCNFSMAEQRKKNLALISPSDNFYDGQSSVDKDQSSVDNGSEASEGDPIFAVLAMALAAAAAWLHWPRDQ